MVVCKFYLQGTCKFGNTCRYEHDVSGGQSHGSSILRQQHSQPQQQLDQNPLVRSVVTDNLAADHGKQWMLSCYAPFKDKRPFPGFEDRSFEEIRYGFVEATTNGTLEQFKQEFNALYQDALNRTKMLQHPSPNVADLITQVYGAVSKNPTDGTAEQASRSVLASNSVFGQKSNAPSIFGGGQNSSSIFGGNKSVFGQAVPTGGSIFGQNPTGGSIFGQAPNAGQNSGSVFGQNANVGQNSGSVFGQNANVGQNSGSVFGQNSNVGQNSGSIFGQNPNANTGQNTGSIFGQQPGANPTQNSIFGQNPSQNSVFGQKPDTNLAQNPVFGQNVNNQSIFGQNTAGNSGVFGQNPTNPPSIFGQGNPNPSSSIFGQTMPESGQQGVFGSVFTQNKPAENQNQTPFGSNIAVLQNTPFVQNPSAPQPSIFGGAQSHSSSIFGTPVVSQNVAVPQQAVSEMLEKLYSKLAELGVDEVKSFEGTMFEFGNIPEVPPPRELCF